MLALEAQRKARGIFARSGTAFWAFWAWPEASRLQTHKVTDFRQTSDGQGLALVLKKP
jgi:hypothetical protein